MVISFLCSFIAEVNCHIFNARIFHVVTDNNQDEEDEEDLELEEGNDVSL